MSKQLTDELNVLTASLSVYNTKVKNFHWNMEGKFFFVLHPLLDEVYSKVDAFIDETAERVRTQGAVAIGTMSAFLEQSLLSETEPLTDTKKMLRQLHQDGEMLLKQMRKVIETAEKEKDAVTADLLTGMMEYFEKMGWMFSAQIS